MERKMRADYEARIGELLDGLSVDNHATAVALASLPEMIRGFGRCQGKEPIGRARRRKRGLMDAMDR